MNTETKIDYMGQKRPSVCALISLGNALLHFGVIDKPWDQESEEFALLVRDAGAEHGSATNIDEIADRFTAPPRWPRIRYDSYTALEMSKELVVRLLDRGAVVALPVWVEGLGLHSILIVGHVGGQWFTALNREPFTGNPVKNHYDWEVLGYRRWNVPVRVYWRAE
jgi:hypothetical protein